MWGVVITATKHTLTLPKWESSLLDPQRFCVRFVAAIPTGCWTPAPKARQWGSHSSATKRSRGVWWSSTGWPSSHGPRRLRSEHRRVSRSSDRDVRAVLPQNPTGRTSPHSAEVSRTWWTVDSTRDRLPEAFSRVSRSMFPIFSKGRNPSARSPELLPKITLWRRPAVSFTLCTSFVITFRESATRRDTHRLSKCVRFYTVVGKL
jgi:hypothetical protein